MKFAAPRGTHDILPADQPRWQRVRQEMETVCALYGYRRIETPVFEETALFERTSGAGSDIVQKEMYTFTDRGDRSLTLRPEATAPIARAYVEHGLHREPQPQKLYTIATMYRYAAPQRGRFREHWQLSVEAIGSADPAVDAEVIQLYSQLLARLGVTQFELRLNSIGDAACRPQYVERLRTWLDEHGDELDPDTRAKRNTSPLRALDNLEAKPPAVQAVLETAPTIADALCDECRAHFDEVRRHLDRYGVAYELVPTLVRGLDYYTRTTWEFVGPEAGSTSALSGGGRYDGLVEEIGGPATPGIGFGAGLERLLLALEQEGVGAEAEPLDVFLVYGDGEQRDQALEALRKLRLAGISCDTDYAGRSQNGQLKLASRLKPRATLVVHDGSVAQVRRSGRDDFDIRLSADDFVEEVRAALA